jgi:Ca2+-binding RTX toxin-like protein
MSGSTSNQTINLTNLAAASNVTVVDAALGTDVVNTFEGIMLGSGADSVAGSTGDNWIAGGAGNDTLDGGAGNDMLSFAAAAVGIIFDLTTNFGAAVMVADGQGGTDLVSNFENIDGGSGNDVFTGSSGSNLMFGGNGNDTLDGGSGQDSVYGGAGNDLLLAAWDAFADTMIGEAGTDILSYQNVSAALSLTGFYGNDATLRTFSVNSVNDTYQYVEGLIGGSGNDTIATAGGTGVYLDGFSGNDSITGGTGSDTLLGGDGNDTLIGGGGNDTFNAGAGNDRMQFQSNETVDGGTGVDTIWFATAATANLSTSTTFAASDVEILDLSAANVGLTVNGTNVAAMASSSNAAVNNASYAGKQVLVIDGEAGDSLALTGGEWTNTGTTTTVNSAGSFSIYKFGTTDVYVATDLNATLS